MEVAFAGQLEAALDRRKAYLEEKVLPRLRERLAAYQGLFESIYKILMRKSAIHEDPYQGERKSPEITVPATDAFLDTERSEKMSQRLAEYRTQLDFLNTAIPLDLEFLALKRLKRIRALAAWIDWARLSESAADPNTAALAFFIGRIRLGSDTLSTGILSTAVRQLEGTVQGLLELLEEIARYQRERYKLDLRRKVLARMPGLNPDSQATAINAIRRQFPQLVPGETFFTDLVEETVAEEFFDPGGSRRAKALQSLLVPETHPDHRKPPPAQRHREILLEGAQAMARACQPLAEALRKLTDNHQVLIHSRRGLLRWLGRWLRRLTRPGSDRPVYEIRLLDPTTSSTRVEPIDFQTFQQEVLKRIRLFETVANPAGAAWQRLKTAEESQLYEFLSRNLGELRDIRQKMEGLSALFRNLVGGRDQEKLKGIRIELTILKNHQVQAGKKRHEYVALREEQEQLKRLGMEGGGPA